MNEGPKFSDALLRFIGEGEKKGDLINRFASMKPPALFLEETTSKPIASPPRVSPRERLMAAITKFESMLAIDQEVGLRLASTLNDSLMIIDAIEDAGTDILILIGRDTANQPIVVMQHVSQMNVLLTSVSKSRPAIGFTAKD